MDPIVRFSRSEIHNFYHEIRCNASYCLYKVPRSEFYYGGNFFTGPDLVKKTQYGDQVLM